MNDKMILSGIVGTLVGFIIGIVIGGNVLTMPETEPIFITIEITDSALVEDKFYKEE